MAAREHLLGTRAWFLPLATLIAVSVVWEIGVDFRWLEPYFFGSPSRIIAAGAVALRDPSFWFDVQTSVSEFAAGYVIAVVLAVPFGIVTAWFRPLHYLFEPWLAAFNATPRIALLPLVILIAGLGLASKVGIVFLGVFFPVAINSFYGVRTVSPQLAEVTRSFGASGFKRLTTLVLPTAVPFALTGMRIGIGRAVGGVLVAEYFTSQAGLGHFILRAGENYQTSQLLFGAIFITVLALLAFRTIGALEERVRAWRPPAGAN